MAMRTLMGAMVMLGCAATGHAAEKLTRGLVGYMSMDRTLSIVNPQGEELLAGFTRHSQAFTDDLAPVWPNEPRYLPGRFGTGILVEPGNESGRKIAFRNYLPPEVADFETQRSGHKGFTSFRGASVSIVTGQAGKHIGTTRPVMQGTHSLKVVCRVAGSGAVSDPVASIMPGTYVLSLFARSHRPGKEPDKLRIELVAKGDRVVGSAELEVTGVWQRVEATFANGKFTRDTKKHTKTDVAVRILSTRPGQTFSVDGLVLELCGGYSYAGCKSASSWMPGYGYRASEILSLDPLRHAFRTQDGTVAFWAQLRGKRQYRRTLFEIATGNRWRPHLQVFLRNDAQLLLHRHAPKRSEVSAMVKIQPGSWHHYAITWTAKRATVYVDGKAVAEHKDMDIPPKIERLRLGSAGPNAAAGAVVDEALVYNRAIAAAEVAGLAGRTQPLADELTPKVAIRPRLFLETVARTSKPQAWLCDLVNRTDRDLSDVVMTFAIGPSLSVSEQVGRVKAHGAAPVRFEFVADLTTGTYPLVVQARAGKRTLATFRRDVEITRAAAPFDNLMVAPWGWNAPRTDGFTFGCGDVEQAMRDGLHWSPPLHYLGYPRTVDGPDWVHGMNDIPFRASFTSPYMIEQVDRKAERLSRRYEAVPAMRGVTPNSEMQWLWQHDYTPSKIAWVRKTFKFNLSTWRYPPKERWGVDRFQTPFGRLKPSVAKIKLPPDRIISTKMPIYAYHRWFHGPTGPTESYLSQRLSEKIHQRRPEILTIQEPILRRAAVRAFDRMSIAQEWFYYEDPMRAVMVQERLNTAARGTPLRPTGMPQFLFKKGGAAPYNSIATAHMWHETVWLCALQPIRMFTYWNYGVVPRRDFENHYCRCTTKAQLDKLFGTPTPTWKQAQAALKDKPTLARKLMPWTPELIATFRRFHNEQVGPLGALIPRWRNRPRRIAMLRSFASQLFREVRWPRATWLENCVVYSGVPFDVLYDSDFEADADPLATYQMVVVSRAVCLTRPTYDWLVKFAKRGGTIVVDPDTKVKLPGAVCLTETDAAKRFADRLAAAQAELARRHGSLSSPAYLIAASELTVPGALPNRVEPAFLDLLGRAVKPEARSLTPNTWLNLLEAEGAHYIGVVNDLRVRGPMYGHFGKVREMGVPQTARVVFDPRLGAVAYDLLAHKPVDVKSGQGRSQMSLALPGGGARVVMLLRAPIGSLRARAKAVDAKWGAQTGRDVRIEARLTDTQGRPVPGLVPATIAITRPDGTHSDFSCHRVIKAGRLRFRFPLPRNMKPGTWKVHVLERASGKTAEVTLGS